MLSSKKDVTDERTRRRRCRMGALTPEERRRVFLARQEAGREGLLGTGWVAYHVVEFHIPASIAATLPRL